MYGADACSSVEFVHVQARTTKLQVALYRLMLLGLPDLTDAQVRLVDH